MEPHQPGDAFAVFEVLRNARSQDRAELLNERLKRLGPFVGESRQMVEHFFAEDALELRQELVILQRLARYVEGQIGRIDHSVQKPQVIREKIAAIVLYEDALRAQVDPVLDLTEAQKLEIRLRA